MLVTDLVELAFVFRDRVEVDLRTGDDIRGLGVDDHEAGHEAFGAEDAALLEFFVGQFADGIAINVDVAARHGADDRGLAVVQVDDVAVFGQHDVLRIDAGLDGDHAVGHQVAVFAVDRHGALRLDDVVHVQQFAFVAVAGDVHGGVVSVDHAGSELHELVDDLVDAMLVASGSGSWRGSPCRTR